MQNIFKRIFTFFLVIIHFSTFAQKENTKWYFGNKAGIDFSSGSPVILKDSKTSGSDNSCSVADSAGNLLFYFDGLSVYNKDHKVMNNGTNLGSDGSAGQVAVSLRKPGTGNIYYLFTVEGYAKSNGLCYSILDMSANKGLGDIITKKISLKTPTCEKLALARHANNEDFWLISHRFNSDEWECFLITTAGVNTSSIVSSIGSKISKADEALGNMDINADFTKVASALYSQGRLEIFDFDNNTGKLSNAISLTDLPYAWSPAFSPNGKMLYFTQWTTDKLLQYDLSSYNKTDIEKSKVSLGPVTGPDAGYKAGYMTLGPDGKIYIAKYSSSYLGVINDPDKKGSSCNFKDDGINISPGKSEAGLPNKTLGTIWNTNYITTSKKQAPILLYPNPTKDYLYVTINQNFLNSNYSILDEFGRVCLKGKSNEINYKIDISHLMDGIYFFVINGRLNTKCKFVK